MVGQTGWRVMYGFVVTPVREIMCTWASLGTK
jgi:hypothetical protein